MSFFKRYEVLSKAHVCKAYEKLGLKSLINIWIRRISSFRAFFRYSYMIDNIILLITGTLHQRPISELIPKCHPLGSFEQMEAIHIAGLILGREGEGCGCGLLLFAKRVPSHHVKQYQLSRTTSRFDLFNRWWCWLTRIPGTGLPCSGFNRSGLPDFLLPGKALDYVSLIHSVKYPRVHQTGLTESHVSNS